MKLVIKQTPYLHSLSSDVMPLPTTQMAATFADLSVSAALLPYATTPPRRSFPPSKVEYNVSLGGGSISSEALPKWSQAFVDSQHMRCNYRRPVGAFGKYNVSPKSISQDVDSLLLNAVNMSFFERLNLAWKILFPSATITKKSNANIAKQRLRMILFSDRCAVSDEAKQKIVKNIVTVLSDFVEIESQDKVQLSVSTDPDIGTIYSVTVPVRRVKPEYQDGDEVGAITNIEYMDTGDSSGAVDVKFDFYIPNEEFKDFSR